MLARTLFTAIFFALASFTVATPPGCLLGAVNSYEDPVDVKAVCSSKDASETIAKFCGDATEDALSAFADICNGAGVKVSTNMPSSSGSGSSATATASGSKATGSMAVQPSGNSTSPAVTGSSSDPSTTGGADAPSGTTTGAGSQFTGAAGRMEIGAAAAIFGLFAVVL